MDVCGAEQGHRKNTAEETTRQPLAPSEKNNAISQRPRTREATARYKIATSSPSLSTHVVHKRCQSPNVTRTIATSSPSISKRAQSAERSRPSTPSSLLRPSTPDSSAEMQISSRRLMGSRTLEGLWPSTMRSLCVSFQSDAFSLPISKREKPVAHNSSEHTLKSSANVAHKQAATLAAQRKATPERKRTPLRGHKASDQSENSRPLNNSHARVVDQQRWANRTGGKVSASALTRSMDVTDRGGKAASLPFPGRGILPLRRTPISDGLCRPLQKSVSEVANQVVYDKIGRMGFETYSVGDASLRLSGIHRLCSSNVGISSSLSERALSITHSSRSQSLPITGSPRPPSPSRASLRSSSPSRGMPSPSRTRPSNPFPSLSSNSFSVLSFIGDVRRGKKGVNLIEDAQQLRLLYNRYLQWRFTNAQADAALSIQKVIAEEILFNVWNTILELRDSVTMKRINLRQMRQEMKINLILKDQMAYLDDWALLEREYLSSLSGAIEALEASTLRLPVAGGTRADIHTMKDAICSAVDVMQATGSSICSLLSRVEGINYLVSELADVAAQERTVLDECGDLLVSTVAMQIEENSLRTHLIQLKQALCNGAQPISALRTLV